MCRHALSPDCSSSSQHWSILLLPFLKRPPPFPASFLCTHTHISEMRGSESGSVEVLVLLEKNAELIFWLLVTDLDGAQNVPDLSLLSSLSAQLGEEHPVVQRESCSAGSVRACVGTLCLTGGSELNCPLESRRCTLPGHVEHVVSVCVCVCVLQHHQQQPAENSPSIAHQKTDQ